MYQLYSLLLTLGFGILLPRFIFDAFRHGKYVAGFRERLGSLTQAAANRPTIWLHCVSVGETQAARPLADLILRDFPNHALVVSTITLTGQQLAKKVFQEKAQKVIYFPFDWRWSVRRSIRSIKPTAVLLMETELWPNFLRECAAQGIPVALVNGRISYNSVRRYRMVRSFFKRVVGNLDRAVMQTVKDADRLRGLGFPNEKLFVSGSMKFDAGVLPASSDLRDMIAQRFGLKPSDNLIVAASTHAPEEKIILESLSVLRNKGISPPRLMLAPRHPERFSEVASLLKSLGLSWRRRTDEESTLDNECQVILLDTIGELPAVYSLASIVFVGGSIANSGGHNVLEPAAAGRCIVTGPHTANFAAIVDAFTEAEAIVQLPSMPDRDVATELARTFEALLKSPGRCAELGGRALLLIEQNQGAAERTLKLIQPMLNHSASKETSPATHTQE